MWDDRNSSYLLEKVDVSKQFIIRRLTSSTDQTSSSVWRPHNIMVTEICYLQILNINWQLISKILTCFSIWSKKVEGKLYTRVTKGDFYTYLSILVFYIQFISHHRCRLLSQHCRKNRLTEMILIHYD